MGIQPKDSSQMGVNKVIILAFCGDLKMIHICRGLGSCSSRYCCPYCEVARVKGVWGVFTTDGKWVEGGQAELRSYARDLKHYEEWCRAGAKKSKAMDFKNVVAPPLLGADRPDTPTLLVTPPPQLHLFLGLNHIMEALQKQWPGLEDWMKGKSLIFSPYHGNVLEGNECARLVTYLDELALAVPAHLRQFVTVLELFSQVVNSCFSYTVLASYRKDLEKLEAAYSIITASFGATVSNKLHILFTHVAEYVEMSGGKGLGESSEQSLETFHYAFSKVWQMFCVKDTEHESYLDRYLKVVRNESVQCFVI